MSRKANPTVIGAFVMGALSSLIVTACVAPALVAALAEVVALVRACFWAGADVTGAAAGCLDLVPLRVLTGTSGPLSVPADSV